MNPNISYIYDAVLNICTQKGLITALNKSLHTAESERFNAQNISSYGLDVLDAVHCLTDKNRTYLLLEELDKQIKEGEHVLEAGIGTGILSFFIAIKGSKVCGLELNPNILKLANDIKEELEEKNIIPRNLVTFLLQNAITYTTDTIYDVLVSENLYTGMFYEKQVQIMNNLIRFTKEEALIIPSGLRTSVYLTDTHFTTPPKEQEMFVRNELTKENTISFLSEEATYNTLDFKQENLISFDKTLSIQITNTGTIDSLLICSEVLLPSGNEIEREDTEFLNNDILIAIPEIRVVEGEIITLQLSYQYGSKPSDALIKLTK